MPDNKSIVVGLDLGSSAFRCIAASIDSSNSLRFLSGASIAAQGWQRGRVTDPQVVAEAIHQVTREVEVTSGLPVESVVLGVGGPTVRGVNSRGSCELWPAREIVQADVNRAVERACALQFREDQMILQVFPQYFTVNQDNEYRDPRGIPGSMLEANVHVIVTSKSEHEAIVGLCNQAHVHVEDTVFEPVATALAAILPADRQDGVALIDIGIHSTELVVYYREMLIHSACIPIGSEHFTRDVSKGLQVGIQDAEMLKMEYGCALVGLTADNSRIELPASTGRQSREAGRRRLNFILEARGRDLFRLVREELDRVQMAEALGSGVMLSGGGSLLPGFCDLAEQSLNCPARLALPIGVRDLPDAMNEASWSTAAGLAMYAARLRLQEHQRRDKENFLVRMFG